MAQTRAEVEYRGNDILTIQLTGEDFDDLKHLISRREKIREQARTMAAQKAAEKDPSKAGKRAKAHRRLPELRVVNVTPTTQENGRIVTLCPTL